MFVRVDRQKSVAHVRATQRMTATMDSPISRREELIRIVVTHHNIHARKEEKSSACTWRGVRRMLLLTACATVAKSCPISATRIIIIIINGSNNNKY